MEDQRPLRRRSPRVVCPACMGLGRNGPEGSVCRVCWLTGVVDPGKYEKIMAERARRGEQPQPPSDDDPSAVPVPA